MKAYVESGIKLNGFSVLALRLKRASKKLLDDVKLVNLALQKMEDEAKGM